MSIESERLVSLIEYAQQSALLRSTPESAVSQHRLFALYEHELQGLPGIRLNFDSAEGEDEIWLAVERIHETRPPEITSAVLRPWVQMEQGPIREPELLATISGSSLIAAGTHRSSHIGVLTETEEDKPSDRSRCHDRAGRL